MDDFDDYFDDDIVLDDEALAVLDNEEKRFTSQAISSTLPVPASKRLKTNNNWVPGPGNLTYSNDFDEDLPEVSVAENGTYDLGSRMAAGPSRARPAKPLSFTHSSRPTSVHHSHQPGPSRFNSLQSRTAAGSPPSNTRLEGSIPFLNHIQHENLASDQPTRLNEQLTELERRIDELRADNEKMRTALKEATEGKLMKEGEVSVLRKNMEKSSQMHAEQIAKFKAAKEEADAKQLQMQKEMKVELERLKTQFAFKQQEYETASRKPVGTTRNRKSLPDLPEPNIRTYNLRGVEPTKFPETILMHDFQGTKARGNSPRKSQYASPGKSRKAVMLPGFQNSFVTSTPLPQPNFSVAKSQASMTDQGFGISSQFDANLPSSIQPHVSSSINVEPMFDHDGDIIMNNDEVQDPMGETDTLVQGVSEANRKLQLYQVILTHRPPGTQFTLHTLLGLSASGCVPPDLITAYSNGCSTLLELMVGAIESSDSYENILASLCKIFTTLLSLLSSCTLGTPLISFLNLLSHLIANYYQFGLSLLDVILLDCGSQNNILDILFSLLQQLQTSNQSKKDAENLITATISCLELLCFSADVERMDKFMCVANYPDVVSYLLDTQYPVNFSLSVSFFIALANHNHEGILRMLLGIPDSECSPSLKDTKDPENEGICVRRMCLTLARDLPEVEPAKPGILTFFGAVLISCPDAWNIFRESRWIIPTLVLHLDRLSSPLWRDDESLYDSPLDILSLIHNMNKILYLLYYLVFNEDSNINMRKTLLRTPPELSGHISEVFIVTFSRLSFADAPEWMDKKAKIELEFLADIARELLDLVLDGPDGELAWFAYQRSKDVPPIEDDEAWEAELTKGDIRV